MDEMASNDRFFWRLVDHEINLPSLDGERQPWCVTAGHDNNAPCVLRLLQELVRYDVSSVLVFGNKIHHFRAAIDSHLASNRKVRIRNLDANVPPDEIRGR